MGGLGPKQTLPLGKQYNLRAYQTCKLQGHRFDPTNDSEAVQQIPCEFVTSLVAVKQLKSEKHTVQQLRPKAQIGSQ